jgi:hypothetical protein
VQEWEALYCWSDSKMLFEMAECPGSSVVEQTPDLVWDCAAAVVAAAAVTVV